VRARPRNVFRVSLPSGYCPPTHRRAEFQVGTDGLVYWIIPAPTPAERKRAERAERDWLRARFEILQRRTRYN